MLLDDAPSFLSLTELQDEIEKYSYRAGWELSVFADPWEGPCLYIVAEVQDGYDSCKTTELRVRSNIPPMKSEKAFGIWLQWRLIQMEVHESREYLHKNGKPLFDPHDPVEPGGKEWPPRKDEPML